ncbi:hypothetical protein GETHLI_16800 [Geothrix limicola]|uniref:Tetratricopeptide repeat protein n=1 Tax=Geothrix limicola TaxID=2927978 RepID=A0ABQ5QES9_9BACT|nr:tetratricopeptide repeat-containing glycosyltransferase family protein [Geothrix limicola]GLH73178.1 hypothetical protein GETHLI_16800 [Geothrix limicola]
MHTHPSDSLETARSLDLAGKSEEALAAFRAYLQAHPEVVEGWVDCAGLLLGLNRLDEAEAACEAALRLDSSHYGALTYFAGIRMNQGRLDESEALFRRAILLEPRRFAARLMLSDCLVRKGDPDQARALLDDVLEQDPSHAIAMDKRSTLMALQGDWAGLRKSMMRQVARYAGAEADYVSSHLDLMFGDMPGGWQRFESRLDIPNRPQPEHTRTKPRWMGEPLAGKTLLLTWEQGFGDTLMFLRYAPLAKALGATVLVEVQPPLAELAATCPGIDQVLVPGEPAPSFDVHASLLSLPALFGTDLESIPAEVPYLRVPDTVPERRKIIDQVNASGDRVRIGICWAGSERHAKDAKRSLPASALAPLSALGDVAWYNFQFEAKEVPPLPGLINMGPLLAGFTNTAFALSHMDLVITADTVLAHLAGALGIPTLLLLSFIPDWRWMLGRSDTPWYPATRLYRQHTPGDWDSVLRHVVQDLASDPDTQA